MAPMPDSPDLPDLADRVRWAYRFILGRDPEPEILPFWTEVAEPRRILQGLVDSDEFADMQAEGLPDRLGVEAAGAGRAAHAAAHWLTGQAAIGTDFASLRRAVLASAPVQRAVAAAPHAPARARVSLLGRDFALEGPREDRYFQEVQQAGDPSADRLGRIARALRPDGGAGAVGVDAGANLGLATLAMAAAWPGHAALLAAEPDPRTHFLLARNLAANGLDRAAALRMALGAEEGTVTLRRQSGNGAVAQLESPDAAVAACQGPGIPVALRPLDRVLADAGLDRLDLLKLDVEGAEGLVLAGAAGSIARHRPAILVEVNIWTQMVVARRNPLDALAEWSGLLSWLVAFDRDGRPRVMTPGAEGWLWVLHTVLTERGGSDDVVLCDDLAWLERWA